MFTEEMRGYIDFLQSSNKALEAKIEKMQERSWDSMDYRCKCKDSYDCAWTSDNFGDPTGPCETCGARPKFVQPKMTGVGDE
jgi:hypothetical protein